MVLVAIAVFAGLPAPAQDWTAGESFADSLSSGGQGPEMVVIPGGSFRMGCVSDFSCRSNERPVHEVTIPQPFGLSKYEVTVTKWAACVLAGACSQAENPAFHRGSVRDRTPVVNVSWNDAQAYASWMSEQTGAAYRLPSEAEWEYAARAGTTSAYPWGDDVGEGQANCQGSDCGDNWRNTAPVGSFPANAFGLHDMHGNVWEWVEDCWNDGYEGAPSDGSAWLSGDCSRSISRGGAWSFGPSTLRSAQRGSDSTGGRYNNTGFRVARTLAP